MRFHLDEHVARAVAEGLQRHGVDVTTTSEAGLLGADDYTQLAFAHREGRVLVTHDADFLRLHSQELEHSGIAFCHQEARSVGEIIRMLLLMYELLESEEMKGRVEFF